ncbi:hypothetical protein EBI08_04810 [Staphylococcus aureus]|nr:hypothetical protein EBI08_04810 [Staphylococcus aureus]
MINYVVVLYHSHSFCVGASLTCIVCRNWKSNSSLLGPRTIIEKCLLQAYFHSINYCLYKIVEPSTK